MIRALVVSEEKHEPVSDIDTGVVDSLKVLDPEWPIREADVPSNLCARRCRDDQGYASPGLRETISSRTPKPLARTTAARSRR